LKYCPIVFLYVFLNERGRPLIFPRLKRKKPAESSINQGGTSQVERLTKREKLKRGFHCRSLAGAKGTGFNFGDNRS